MTDPATWTLATLPQDRHSPYRAGWSLTDPDNADRVLYRYETREGTVLAGGTWESGERVPDDPAKGEKMPGWRRAQIVAELNKRRAEDVAGVLAVFERAMGRQDRRRAA